LLTKRTHILSILIAALAFPAAASAEVPRVDPLQGQINSFHRVIRAAVDRFQAEHQAAVRKQQEAFANLPGGISITTLESIAVCESGGDPTAISSDGSYRGKYQFDYGTWESVGGQGDPAVAPEPEQDYRAALLYSQSGSSPWPVCG
jgi:Transglycosylase-like domain